MDFILGSSIFGIRRHNTLSLSRTSYPIAMAYVGLMGDPGPASKDLGQYSMGNGNVFLHLTKLGSIRKF